jgi:SAM-dependent methyltransferase
VNVDITGVSDARGQQTAPGVPYALVADESAGAESPLLPGEPRTLYFLQHDGTRAFPFRTGRFDWIIAEHFLEHLSYPDAVGFLAEARRLLKPGGTLRISTPDLAVYAAAFFDPAQRFFREHYAVMTEAPGMEGNKAWLSNRRADMFNQIFYGYR